MLQQLIAEAENKALVFSDDLSAQISKDQQLQGLQACQNDDVVHNNWLSKHLPYPSPLLIIFIYLFNILYYSSCFGKFSSFAQRL